jgi:hypothetical protein
LALLIIGVVFRTVSQKLAIKDSNLLDKCVIRVESRKSYTYRKEEGP